MRFLPLLCVVLVLSAFSGCRRRTSPEFYKLEADQSILVSRDGDDAYASPELARIIAALQALPDNVVEKERATALAAKLSAEVARVAADRPVVAAAPVPQGDPYAGRLHGTEAIEAPPPPAADVDAGPPTEPWTGMDEPTFASLFGKCFEKGPKSLLANGTPVTTQVLGPAPECQKAMGTPGGVTSYLFVDGGVWGKTVETTVVRDAGFRVEETTPRPPPPPPDAGENILTIPGAPLPEGYQKSTVY